MAESFIRQLSSFLIKSVKDKQESILKEIGVAQDKAHEKFIKDKEAKGEKVSDEDKAGGKLGSIDQSRAMELQVSAAELSSISAAGTGIIAGEKNAIAAIARNI